MVCRSLGPTHNPLIIVFLSMSCVHLSAEGERVGGAIKPFSFLNYVFPFESLRMCEVFYICICISFRNTTMLYKKKLTEIAENGDVCVNTSQIFEARPDRHT